MPNTEPPSLMDPEHWARRFDELVRLVKANAELARKLATDAATNAAIKVTAENTRAQEELRRELLQRQEQVRKDQQVMHNKVDAMQDNLSDVLITLNKLSTAKLTQLGITALILAALVIIGIKALGG